MSTALPFAVFDEFGKGADDRVQDHVHAALSAQAEAHAVQIASMQKDCKDAGNALGEVEQENDALRAQVEALRASINMGDSKQQETI
jgi:hypothetical protein